MWLMLVTSVAVGRALGTLTRFKALLNAPKKLVVPFDPHAVTAVMNSAPGGTPIPSPYCENVPLIVTE